MAKDFLYQPRTAHKEVCMLVPFRSWSCLEKMFVNTENGIEVTRASKRLKQNVRSRKQTRLHFRNHKVTQQAVRADCRCLDPQAPGRAALAPRAPCGRRRRWTAAAAAAGATAPQDQVRSPDASVLHIRVFVLLQIELERKTQV